MIRKQRIESLIVQHLNPVYLHVTDNSHQHQRGQETHFTLVVVSELFAFKSAVARHRMLHQLLGDELNSGLHAISLQLFSPEEWSASDGQMTPPPPCRGGEHRQ